MRAPLLAALLALAASPALAAVQSYDAVCPGPCTASDGTTQPAGTVLKRFNWDGVAQYTPQDFGTPPLALNAVADPNQTTALYQPVVPSVSVPTYATTAQLSAAIAALPVPLTAGSQDSSGNLILTNANNGTTTITNPAMKINPSSTYGRATATVPAGTIAVGLQKIPLTLGTITGAAPVAGDVCAFSVAAGFTIPANEVILNCQIDPSSGQPTLYADDTVVVAGTSFNVNVSWHQ